MCDPLTIASVALTAGSAVANNAAANQQAKAQASAMSAERARQSGFNREREALQAQATNRYDDYSGQEEAKRSSLNETFAENSERGAELVAANLPRTSSNITTTEDERKRGEATDFANQQQDALVRMRSFGDLFGDIGVGVNRDGQNINTVNSFARGSQGALPFELEAAAQKGQGLRTAADLMQGIGSIGMNAGLSGANLFGGQGVSTNVISGPMTSSPIPRPRPAGLGGLY